MSLVFLTSSEFLPPWARLNKGADKTSDRESTLSSLICLFIFCFFGMIDLFDNVELMIQ
jgi:hypothetical protein